MIQAKREKEELHQAQAKIVTLIDQGFPRKFVQAMYRGYIIKKGKIHLLALYVFDIADNGRFVDDTTIEGFFTSFIDCMPINPELVFRIFAEKLKQYVINIHGTRAYMTTEHENQLYKGDTQRKIHEVCKKALTLGCTFSSVLNLVYLQEHIRSQLDTSIRDKDIRELTQNFHCNGDVLQILPENCLPELKKQ